MKISTLLLIGALMTAPAAFGDDATQCPSIDLGETQADCPWAGVARTMVTPGQKPLNVLRQRVPALVSQMQADARAPGLQGLWGTSINYDELARGIIVDPSILDALYRLAAIRKPRLPAGSPAHIQHAGLEHTYGYLFSLLRTSFGYKRARWVQGEIERGFGLPEGSLSPSTPKGSLMSNVTYFIGRIAFVGEHEQNTVLDGIKARIHPEVASFDFRRIARTRLEESVEHAGKRLIIRTDLIPFLRSSGGSNEQLLIYSVVTARDQVELITAFPVTRPFGDGIMKPETLGENQPIQTRYNAYVPGFTGVAGLKGARRVIR